MKIVNPKYEIIAIIDGQKMLETIERAARTCYKSEDKIGDGTARNMVRTLILSHHDAMLEHAYITVRFVVDRGVSHELVRHRMASFAQESTRYCRHRDEITVIRPLQLAGDPVAMKAWIGACEMAEDAYLAMIEAGVAPEDARSVLPMSLKTEIIVTANLREWRHILALRAIGTTGRPHPQMREVMAPLLEELKERVPVVFDDLVEKL